MSDPIMKTLLIQPTDLGLRPLGADTSSTSTRVSVVYDRDVWWGGQPIPRVPLVQTMLPADGMRVPVLASDDPAITEGAGFVIKIVADFTPRTGLHPTDGAQIVRTIRVTSSDDDMIPLGSKPNLVEIPDPVDYAAVSAAILAAERSAADALTSRKAAADSAASSASSQAAAAAAAADAKRIADAVSSTDDAVAQVVQTGKQTPAAITSLVTTIGDGRYSKTSALAKVATSGAYTDLTGAPKLAKVATSGTWADVQGKPWLTGTGAPASSLGAVGDVYIDTAATAGALRWVKWPSGWGVDVGDTGRRDVSATLNDPYKGATMPALFVARTGSIVTMTAVNVQLTAAGSAGQTIATLPAGFRPETPSTPAGNANNTFRITTGGVLVTSYAYASGIVFSLTAVYRTIEAWPSTLPGVAA